MAHILAISSLSNLYFFPFVHPFIFRYGNIDDLNFLHGFINKNNIWLSSFNLGITLNCKIPQNLVPFVLNNPIWFMLVSYIHSQYVILSCFLLYTLYTGVIHQSYLYEISHDLFSELVLEHYKLKPQCLLLNYFSLATSMCCSCPCLLFV